MSSYFSQLAKQSGLPIAASGKKTPSSAKSSGDTQIEPLHKEKTILTSSTVIDSVDQRSSAVFPKSEQKQTTTDNPLKIKPEKQKRPKTSESENQDLQKPNLLKTETFKQDASTEISKKEILEKVPKKSAEKENQSNEPENLKIVKEVSYSEAETAKEEPEINLQETLPEKPEKKTTSENPHLSEFNAEKDRKYFEKTTRILVEEEEEGESSSAPEEIEQIFLNEIQQWVADSPALKTADLPVSKEENKETKVEKINTVKVSSPKVVETSGLPDTPEASETNSDLSETEPVEQNLSLSIGTISIVIEDSEENVRPAENLINKGSAGNEPKKAERKFSRLSRRYL